MALADAAWAIREAFKVFEEAEDMFTAGAVGDVLDETLRHARELLDIIERELVEVDRNQYKALFAAPLLLRGRLERLRNEFRGRARR